ncbi:MAG: oxygen-independent coproporphyrinogen III oxidase [Bacteroidota bacterium]
MKDLLNKYNVPAPRYTSYPTVPLWDTAAWSQQAWQKRVTEAFWINGRELSLYIHLPYCENLCTYCGCHKYITKNHSVEAPYISTVLQEWQMYLDLMPGKPILKELHLGGGTPTFFSPQELGRLVAGILKDCETQSDTSISLEGHPSNTTVEHLQTLYDLGARRLSLGIQDFDPKVQQTIHRLQSKEEVAHITQQARKMGYTSINYDLIYGLPRQSAATIAATIEAVGHLAPDRIAYYSYAHVPWMRPAQKSYEHLLPSQEEKLEMYLKGKELLGMIGYEEIGMDHFSLSQEELYLAQREGRLHRNFMGYTTQSTQMAIGLGASAIGDTWDAFAQNEKDIKVYQQLVNQDRLPVTKGHVHDEADLFFRRQILNIMCAGKTVWGPLEMDRHGLQINWELIDELRCDGLISVDDQSLTVTLLGRQFLRNISMAFDARLGESKRAQPSFSQAI